MKNFIFLSLIILSGCAKTNIETKEVLHNLKVEPSTLQADGTSMVFLSVEMNKEADASKRKVVFDVSGGAFVLNGSKTLTTEALYENGLLIARATLRNPISPGLLKISVHPEERSPYHDFIVRDSLLYESSLPSSIHLEASAFAVSTNYIGEILVTGTLKNAERKNVSAGTKVNFSDVFLNGSPVNGRYRQVQFSSNDASTVSAYYSPGAISPGMSLYVISTVLGNGDLPTDIKDTILINVIP